MNEWIKTEDELPPPFTCVLVIDSTGFMLIAEVGASGVWVSELGNVYNNAIYWMPLPELPEDL